MQCRSAVALIALIAIAAPVRAQTTVEQGRGCSEPSPAESRHRDPSGDVDDGHRPPA